MARNQIFSGQIENLRTLLNINRGMVTFKKRSQNLILTTRIVRNWCLGVFGEAANLISFVGLLGAIWLEIQLLVVKIKI